MKILLCNGKGGTGKTTLCVLLASALADAGKRVAVLDRDPQGTARKWIAECGGGVAIHERGAEYDAVLIDTPPRLDTLAPAVLLCSVAVIVSSPSPADLWTTQATAEAVRGYLPDRGQIRLLFNGVSANTILARDLTGMADRVGVKALAATISRRQCYQHAALLGWAALDRAAREEVSGAALEIITGHSMKV